jgi:hypothetical protein
MDYWKTVTGILVLLQSEYTNSTGEMIKLISLRLDVHAWMNEDMPDPHAIR